MIATSAALFLTYFIVLPYAGRRLLIVEEGGVQPAQLVLGAVPTVMGRIGGRRVYLFEKPVSGAYSALSQQ